MSIIKCPECKNQISNENLTCPYCGSVNLSHNEYQPQFTDDGEYVMSPALQKEVTKINCQNRMRKVITRIVSFVILFIFLLNDKFLSFTSVIFVATTLSLVLGKMMQYGIVEFLKSLGSIILKVLKKLVAAFFSIIVFALIGSIIGVALVLAGFGMIGVIIEVVLSIPLIWLVPLTINVVCNVLDINYLRKNDERFKKAVTVEK